MLGIGGECTHLSSFGDDQKTDGGVGEEWEVPVLQSSGLRGIWKCFLGVLSPRKSLGKCAEVLTVGKTSGSQTVLQVSWMIRKVLLGS